MLFRKGDMYIVAETTKNEHLDDRFGKRPRLWAGAGNQLIKVASFSSEDKARLFVKWMEFLMSAERR